MKRFFLLILLTILCGCYNSSEQETINYDYDSVTTSIEWSDIFNQMNDYYLVYFYKTTCAHCRDIKQDILSYYHSTSLTLYFVLCDQIAVYGNPGDLTGVDKIEEFYIFGTPFLITIENRKVKDYYPGVAKIREFMTNNP